MSINLKSFTKLFQRESSNLDESTFWRTSLYDESQWERYNPDSLVQTKGIKIYRQMMKDDQVKACLTIKKNAIFSKGWRIVSASDDEADKKISEFIEFALTDGLQGSFRKVVNRILSAFQYGFSISEEIPHLLKSGDFKGKIVFRKIKTRPPDGFQFDMDDFGNLNTLEQDEGAVKISGADLNRIIIFSHDSEFSDEVWGIPDLRAAYRWWWIKDVIAKFLAIFIERFGMGILVGKYPRGMGKESRDILQKMLKNVSAKTAVDIPTDVDISVLESNSRSQSIHIPAIEHCNKSIARAILLPDKLGFTDSPGGSYNLGENQFSLFMMILDNLRAEIEEEIIDEQIVKRLVDLNFPNVTKYPKFKFNPLTQKDKEKLAEIFTEAVTKGVVQETEADEDYFRESIEYPKRDRLSPLIERPKPAPAPGFGGNPNGDEPEIEEDEDGNPIPVKDKIKKFAKIVLSRNPTIYEMKIDFKKTVDDVENLETKYEIKIGDNVERIKESLINLVISKNIVENKDSKAVDKIQLKHLSDLRFTFGQLLNEAYFTGKRHAKQDIISKKNFAKVMPLGNLPPKETLKFFNDKKFWLTGNERDFILNGNKSILYNAIEKGASNSETVFEMEEFFEKYKVTQKTPQGTMEVVSDIPGRVEVIVRTNTNNAYNQGKLATFQDPLVADFIPAYQYSAIMDGRTSDICIAYDKQIWKSGDNTWQDVLPPNHHNCRSTIVPILSDEEFEVSPPPKIEPAKGFGG